ncbi:SDR family oxidoreductase [Martelella endophytica]|uniref:Gluconate 5-dehydrogenase n=1 Tax=Martelella endophytica TaxID=1486262 RepID=A0A0D5LR91_MAREN|nr:SDR family oxidoreductase [Martelella endophytica]AJY46749.1 gluconate 5-dehydrogenase [Martelella endophytica]
MTSLDRFLLTDRVAIVTGAGRGLGFEIARGFCDAGAHVVITGRNSETLAQACAELKANGGSADYTAFDIADRKASADALKDILATHGGIDILVNNVGARDRRSLDAFTDDEIATFMETDLLAAISLSRDVARSMKASGYGRLIFLTSILGTVALPGDNLYPVAKMGLTGLTRALAVEYGPYGITSNAIAPGMFATETNAHLATDAQMLEFTKMRVPLQRWGRPEEIAGAALFLASEAGSFVNGQTLTVDGGHSIRM